MSSVKYLLALAIVAILTGTAFAVHCFQCESSQNPKCGEHFEADDSLKVDCSRISAPFYTTSLLGRNVNATGCVKKIMQKATGGQTYILRTCFHGDISNPKDGCEMDPHNTFVKQLECNVCSGDLCNGSSSMTPIALAVVAFVALARILS